MNDIADVAKFMMLGGQTVPYDVDDYVTASEMGAFIDRVVEEHNETCEGIYYDDEVEIVDGFLDIAYAAMTGAIRKAGATKAALAWEAILDANLAKVDGRHGPVVRNEETGKIEKPEGWTAPDIEKILQEEVF